MADTASLAVWDVPMPVVAGERFSIKVGVKSASGRARGRVEISDAAGTAVASAAIRETPWTGTEALYWVGLDVPAPASAQLAEYAVRFTDADSTAHEALATRFSVVAAPMPEHKLTVKITERDSSEALAGVEIRLGPFHARTDASGQAELRIGKGEYQLHLWRTAHIAPPQPIAIKGDASIALTMVHVPEEHPDARWVR